ncbi:MAG: DUF1707 domain-containing protein [Aeromicrobium erythreum]
MSDISDPGGAGRGDRRRARQAVDAAYAEGRVTAADRALRMQQIEAASTKGDLAMVVRDLSGPFVSSDGPRPAVQRAAPSRREAPASWTPTAPGPSQAPPTGYPRPSGPARQGLQARTIGIIAVAVALLVVVPVVVTVVGLVSSGVSTFDRPRIRTEPTAATRLVGGPAFEPATWRRFVADLREEYGDDVELWSVFAYPDRYSGYVVLEDDRSQFVTWSDGRLSNTLEPRDNIGSTPPIPVDDIDPAVFRRVVQAAVDDLGETELTALYVYVMPTTYDDTFYRGSAQVSGESTSVRFDRDGNRITP